MGERQQERKSLHKIQHRLEAISKRIVQLGGNPGGNQKERRNRNQGPENPQAQQPNEKDSRPVLSIQKPYRSGERHRGKNDRSEKDELDVREEKSNNRGQLRLSRLTQDFVHFNPGKDCEQDDTLEYRHESREPSG